MIGIDLHPTSYCKCPYVAFRPDTPPEMLRLIVELEITLFRAMKLVSRFERVSYTHAVNREE
jgi:hypothetical protein